MISALVVPKAELMRPSLRRVGGRRRIETAVREPGIVAGLARKRLMIRSCSGVRAMPGRCLIARLPIRGNGTLRAQQHRRGAKRQYQLNHAASFRSRVIVVW